MPFPDAGPPIVNNTISQHLILIHFQQYQMLSIFLPRTNSILGLPIIFLMSYCCSYYPYPDIFFLKLNLNDFNNKK